LIPNGRWCLLIFLLLPGEVLVAVDDVVDHGRVEVRPDLHDHGAVEATPSSSYGRTPDLQLRASDQDAVQAIEGGSDEIRRGICPSWNTLG
jgi:hypothetical protein